MCLFRNTRQERNVLLKNVYLATVNAMNSTTQRRKIIDDRKNQNDRNNQMRKRENQISGSFSQFIIYFKLWTEPFLE